MKRWQRMDITKLWGSIKSALASGELKASKKDLYIAWQVVKRGRLQILFLRRAEIGLILHTPFHGGMQCNNEDKAHCVCFKTESGGDKNPLLYIETLSAS